MRRASLTCSMVLALCGCGQLLGLDEYGDGGSGGGGVGSGRCGGLGVLADDFGDGVLAPGWDEELSMTATFYEIDNEAQLWVPALSPAGRAFRTSAHYHDMTGDYVMAEVSEVPSEDGAYAVLELRDQLVMDDWIHIAANGNELSFRSSNTWDIGSVPYNPEAHRFWRIIEEGGALHLETSPDGGDWTRHTSVSSDTLFDTPYVRVTYGLESNTIGLGQAARFKSINEGVATQGWCKAEKLTDPFNDDEMDPLWTRSIVDICSVREIGGEVSMILESNIGSCEYRTGQAFDLTQSSFTVRVAPGSAPATQRYMTMFSHSGTWFDVQTDGALLELVETVDDNATVKHSMMLPTDEWWRVSASEQELSFHTSPDGMSWSQAVSVMTLVPLDAVELGFGIWGDTLTTGGIFSELNTAPR